MRLKPTDSQLLLLVFLFALIACGGEREEERLSVARRLGASDDGSRPSHVNAGNAARGEQLFGATGCNGCHMVDGVGGMVGPELSAVGARPSRDPRRWPTTETYLRASLRAPNALVVPGYTGDMPTVERLELAAQDVEDVVAYLMTLRGQ